LRCGWLSGKFLVKRVAVASQRYRKHYKYPRGCYKYYVFLYKIIGN
jgi:hypothetical protein